MKIFDRTTYETFDALGRNSKIKKAGTPTEWTPELIEEYKRCRDDIEYFARNYVKINTLDYGMVNIDPYPFQVDLWKTFQDNRFTIVKSSRQSGKSIAYVVFILHTAIFTADYTIGILANKGKTAQGILARVALALENLPFFLQPGCKTYNKTCIEFDTNTTILSAATSSDSARGSSWNLVILDEFAFVRNDEEFMTSTYPIITAGKTTKMIIVSTPNGIGNEYFRIWTAAIQGVNLYKPVEVKWSDVPWRDEKFKTDTIKNIGLRKWMQEFECEFAGTSSTLISGQKLLDLRAVQPVEVKNETIRIYEHPKENTDYIMTVDVSKGRGKDFSTFTVFKLEGHQFIQVAVFQDSLVSPWVFPETIYHYAKKYNEAYIIIESNDQGTVVGTTLLHDFEYDHLFVENAMRSDGIGVYVDKKVKAIGCSNLKDLIEGDKIILTDKESIDELSHFESHGRSGWAAKGNKHDDLVANMWLLSWFLSTKVFAYMKDEDFNFRKFIQNEAQDIKKNDVMPFGVYNNGIESNSKLDYLVKNGFLIRGSEEYEAAREKLLQQSPRDLRTPIDWSKPQSLSE